MKKFKKINWYSSLYLSIMRVLAGIFVFILLSVMKIFELETAYPYTFGICFVIFLIASVSDFFDGRIKNKHSSSSIQIIFEQLSDKFLIYPIILFFIKFNLIFTSVVIVLFIRDLTALTGKLILFEKNIYFRVPKIIKFKTTIEIASINIVLAVNAILGFKGYHIEHLEAWKITVSAIFTIIDLVAIYSLIKYYKPIWKYILRELKAHENGNGIYEFRNYTPLVIDDHKELDTQLNSENTNSDNATEIQKLPEPKDKKNEKD
ncbi:hypothetical protein N8G13_02725 [Mycoplasma zalophi]|uniref:CDP-alcohol phosphatidyltransferase family protein n=1 Tax=Mycoplasma zalophi TaxID=191287 RepID=UPI0021C8CE0B|nr:CDP-alcohol phosphatidyltransferase family protein [Mycoplasma zalophi]MCU4117360.1 hypothetical protein [Mycoplasma zalophi]